MSSCFVSKRLSLVLLFAVVAMHVSFVESILSINQTNEYLHHICLNRQGTYKSGSTYERNTNNQIKSMSDIIKGNKIIISSSNKDSGYVKLQCRGDSSTSKCRSCLAIAFSEISRKCPKNKGRIIWYDNCVVEMSSISMYHEIDYQNYFYLSNAKDVSGDKKSFNEKTTNLLNKLKEKAISKENKPYSKDYLYATGEESVGTMKLYAMVQCMQDLSIKNCNVCLKWIMAKFPKCCNGKKGGRVLSTSCNFRYELYPFVKLETM